MLLSLLVVVAIMLIMYKNFSLPEVQIGQQAQQEAQQVSGHDQNGRAAMNSFKGAQYPAAGQFRGIQITDVTAGGAMDTYYGLKVGDIVVKIGDNTVDVFGDYNSAFGQLQEAYQQNAPITVQRDTAILTLPVGGVKSPLDNILGQQH
jgi:S1-C subfamily serine protease